jgi:uncharacterized protein YutD
LHIWAQWKINGGCNMVCIVKIKIIEDHNNIIVPQGSALLSNNVQINYNTTAFNSFFNDLFTRNDFAVLIYSIQHLLNRHFFQLRN